MKKAVGVWQAIGFIVTGTLGTLLHFLFDWTGSNVIFALFSAANESIWEHMKLLFYPMLLFAGIQYRFWGKEDPSFWCVKLFGILAGLALIPVLYYSYTGILGVSADWFNVAIFFIAAGVTYWLEAKLFQRELAYMSGGAAFFFLLLVAVAFTVLTFLPPRIPLFQDPITGTYGFWKL